MFMANADGSNARQIIGGDTPITWLDWTPSGDRIIYTSEIDGVTTMRIVDTTTGAVTALDVGMTVHSPTLRPGHDEFVFHSDDSGSVGYYLATLDGSSVRPIAIPPGAGDQWSMSQDGSKLVYMSWADGPGLDGRLHVIDIDSGKDRLLTPIGDGYEWLNPGFSPDGTQVMAERYVATDTGQYHVVVLPVDGARPATEMGPRPRPGHRRRAEAVLARRQERPHDVQAGRLVLAARCRRRPRAAAGLVVHRRAGVAAAGPLSGATASTPGPR